MASTSLKAGLIVLLSCTLAVTYSLTTSHSPLPSKAERPFSGLDDAVHERVQTSSHDAPTPLHVNLDPAFVRLLQILNSSPGSRRGMLDGLAMVSPSGNSNFSVPLSSLFSLPSLVTHIRSAHHALPHPPVALPSGTAPGVFPKDLDFDEILVELASLSLRRMVHRLQENLQANHPLWTPHKDYPHFHGTPQDIFQANNTTNTTPAFLPDTLVYPYFTSTPQDVSPAYHTTRPTQGLPSDSPDYPNFSIPQDSTDIPSTTQHSTPDTPGIPQDPHPKNHTTEEGPEAPDKDLSALNEAGSPDEPSTKKESRKSTLKGLRPDPDRKFPSTYGRGQRYRRQAVQGNGNATAHATADASGNGNGDDNGNRNATLSSSSNGHNTNSTEEQPSVLQTMSASFSFNSLGLKVLVEQVIGAMFAATSSVAYFGLSRLGMGQFVSTGEMVGMMWTMYDLSAVFNQWMSSETV